MRVYSFKEMTQVEALIIGNEWKYDGEYSFYDMTADADDYIEFISPELRQNYYSAYNLYNELSGFLTYEITNKTVDIGLGLSPSLTGQRKGFQFLSDCIDFIKENNEVDEITLSVAAFNQRAINLYLKCGFEIVSTGYNYTNGGEYEFVSMKKEL